MCSGLFGGSYSAPEPAKVDPAPTPVQAADVQADRGNGDKERKEQSRRRRAATSLAQDRDTILGSVSGNRSTMG